MFTWEWVGRKNKKIYEAENVWLASSDDNNNKNDDDD